MYENITIYNSKRYGILMSLISIAMILIMLLSFLIDLATGRYSVSTALTSFIACIETSRLVDELSLCLAQIQFVSRCSN